MHCRLRHAFCRCTLCAVLRCRCSVAAAPSCPAAPPVQPCRCVQANTCQDDPFPLRCHLRTITPQGTNEIRANVKMGDYPGCVTALKMHWAPQAPMYVVSPAAGENLEDRVAALPPTLTPKERCALARCVCAQLVLHLAELHARVRPCTCAPSPPPPAPRRARTHTRTPSWDQACAPGLFRLFAAVCLACLPSYAAAIFS